MLSTSRSNAGQKQKPRIGVGQLRPSPTNLKEIRIMFNIKAQCERRCSQRRQRHLGLLTLTALFLTIGLSRTVRAVITLCVAIAVFLAVPMLAAARITKIQITRVESPTFEGK